jgi:hypothetical protein
MRRSMTLLLLLALANSALAQTAGGQPAKVAAQNAAPNDSAPAARPSKEATPATPAAQPACGCEGEPPPEVLAVINGEKVTAKEVDDAIRLPLAAIQHQVVEARRVELDLQINSRLLDAEARRRGKTPAQVLEAEVIANTKAPTDAEVRAYFDEHKDQMDSTFEDAKPYIADFLRNRQQAALAKAFADRLRAAADLKVLVAESTPPQTPADRERVFATLNGQAITSAEVEDSLRPLLKQARDRIYDLRKTQLDLRINDLLLRQEAQKRKLTPRAVIEADVLPTVKKVSEADARKFYDGNKERLPGDFNQLRDQLIQYLSENEQQRAQLAYAQRLRAAAAVEVFLKAPPASKDAK